VEGALGLKTAAVARGVWKGSHAERPHRLACEAAPLDRASAVRTRNLWAKENVSHGYPLGSRTRLWSQRAGAVLATLAPQVRGRRLRLADAIMNGVVRRFYESEDEGQDQERWPQGESGGLES